MIPNLSERSARKQIAMGQGHTRRVFIGRTVLIGVGLAAGLGRVRVAGAASQVNIGLASIACHAPTYAAVANGFFQDEGLQATVIDVGANGVLPGLSAGTVDAGMGTVWSVIPPRLPTGRALGDVVITSPLQRGCIALSVPASSEIQSLEDLRGLKVAGSEFLFGTALADAGVNPDSEIVWSAAPSAADVYATLQSGEFDAVQSADGQGALLEVVGEARMIGMINMPPMESNYCCACIMNATGVTSDRPRAAAITRAMMRGSAWAESHRSETAGVMRPSMTVPARREITQEDMEVALAMQAFVPMAETARPILIQQFGEFLTYGLPVDGPMDATTLVNRVFQPITDELTA